MSACSSCLGLYGRRIQGAYKISVQDISALPLGHLRVDGFALWGKVQLAGGFDEVRGLHRWLASVHSIPGGDMSQPHAGRET